MEETFGNTALFHNRINGFSLVVSIRVQCLIGDDVVLKKSLEVLLAIFTKEETVDLRTQLLESEVRRSEDCSSNVGRGICDSWQETSLCKSEFQGTKFARQK